MRLRIFVPVAVVSCFMVLVCSALVFFHVHALRSVDLDPLTESLSAENTKVLLWILEHVPGDRIEAMKLPESWAEIFVLNPESLVLTGSTNPSHKGLPLYRHPLLLDAAGVVVEAMKTGRPTRAMTKDYSLAVVPTASGDVLIALKPKAWERNLVKNQSDRIEKVTSRLAYLVVGFVCLGMALSLAAAYLVTVWVSGPFRKALSSFEALSLGDFGNPPENVVSGKEGEIFEESFIRLKTSLETALDMLSRR